MPFPAFPTFNNGVVSGIDGYGESDLLYSTVETLDSGYGNSYSWNSYYDPDTGIFHNFQEERFSVAFPMFTTAEVATLEAFFASMAGPYGYFTFTDDQNVTWPQCQFDMETLGVQYLGPNQYSVECKILAVTQAPIPGRALPNPPPPPPLVPTINAAVLNIVSAYPLPTGGLTPVAIWRSTGTGGWFNISLNDPGPWTKRTDTFSAAIAQPSAAAGYAGFGVILKLLSTFTQSGLAQLLVYDVNITATMSDSSSLVIRPAMAVVHIGDDLGDVISPALSIDGDQTTAAVIEDRAGGVLLSNPTTLTLTF